MGSWSNRVLITVSQLYARKMVYGVMGIWKSCRGQGPTVMEWEGNQWSKRRLTLRSNFHPDLSARGLIVLVFASSLTFKRISEMRFQALGVRTQHGVISNSGLFHWYF